MGKFFLIRRQARYSPPRTTHYLLTGLLLIAAALRLSALGELPPGVNHDEVAEVLIAEGILAGRHALFFQEAYGQEPFFLYLVAGALQLFGHHVLALRFVAAAVGVLTVAAGARWSRRLFGSRVAVVTAAGLTVMLWSVFWSRVGLRGMTLPLMLSLGVDALWSALDGRRPWRSGLMAGIWFGASAYTYLASRGVPLLLVAFAIALYLLRRRLFQRRWRALLLALVVAGLIAAPLVVYLVRNKEVQTRVYEVDAPLRALLSGDPRPLLGNVPHILGMFTVAGDATVRNNVPARPIFVEPVWATLFYLGALVALFKLRDLRYTFVLLWLGVMVLPSLVTTEAPNFVRTLGALPAVMVLPGIGAEAAYRWLSAQGQGLMRLGIGVIAVAFVLNLALTARAYFKVWPQIPEVAFVWQKDLEAIAMWLDAHPEVEDVTIAGLSPRTLDAPSMDLLAKREGVQARWCDTGSPNSSAGGVLLPAQGERVLIPNVVPTSAEIEAYLVKTLGAARSRHPRFQAYDLTHSAGDYGIGHEFEISFEGDVTLEGFVNLTDVLNPGATLTFMSVWQAGDNDYADLKAFVHLLDDAGEIRAQHDGLDCPARFWRAGDRIVQVHTLSLPADLTAGQYTIRVGLYDRETLEPHPLLDGRLFYEAAPLYVQTS